MSNDSSLERRRAATGSFNSRRSQQSVDSLSSNALLTQSAAITSMFAQAQENRSLSKSTDVIIDPSSALPNQQHNHLEEKSFIKVGDLIYFLSDENIAIFGEGVGSLCGRKNDDSLKTDFLGAIFRVQPKYEYSAQAEFNKYSSSKAPDSDKLEKYDENVQNEKKRNSEEERVLGGSTVYYGQVIQLVHFATNMVLSGDRKQRSDLDPGSLKLELRKEGSKNCWFKIMPRYKVRFEGEEVRQFDKICLIHVKSGMFVKLSDKTYEDNDNNEVHLNSQSTSWTVSHFMSFQPEGDQFIKAGDVIRIFHQEKEGFLKANITPLFGDSHYDLFLKVKGKKSNSSETKSSNTLFLVELKQNIGGMIAWRTEVRLKHLGTGKYLAINYNAKDSSKLNLILTYDIKTYEQETLFVFNPVDPGTNFISFGTYCRIQGKKIGDKKPHWMHVADFIENKNQDLGDKGEDENNMSFARNKFLEVQFTEKFHYEDAVLFKPVPPIEIEELNYVNSLYAVLIDFSKKLKANSLTDSSGNSNFATAIKKSRTNIGILPPDTDPVKDTLKKLITFVNKSDEEDPLKQDGIPNPGHQTLLFEQQMIEASIDILVHLFGFTASSFGTISEINTDSKEKFAREIGKKENKHILELVTLIYKFLQMIVKENHKLGMLVSQWMNIFLTHMGTGVGVRKTLIELFKDNKTLLETIPTKTIDAFVQLLLENGKDAKLLEFLVVVCTCNDSPVLRNQMYILDCLHKNPQLLFSTRPSKDGKNFEINVGVKEEVWIPFEEFVKAKVYKKKTVSDGTKAEENTKEDEKKSQYDYPYNTRYMKEIDYFKQLLQLYYRVCLANDKAVLFLSEGDKESKIPPLMTSDMVFSCLRNDNLPGSLRSYFCDLLYLWVDKDLPASPNSGVKYTWSWDEIVGDYVVKRITEDETKDTKNSWTTKNLTELQHFLFHFLQKNQDLPVGDKENRSLLLSALVVLSKMVNYGFFIEAKDQESLIPVLLQIVNGKTEITPQSTKFSRFEMTESNWPLIKTKLQVCKILHSFYDVRLEKKTAEQLHKYKTFYESDSKEERKKNLGLITASASSEEEKSDDPNEIALRSITYQPTYDEKIRSILLDTSLYQYEPLTTSALSLLLRHMRSRDELISTLERVQLLTDDESVRLYHHITKQIGKLQQILEDNDISTDDSPQIVEIIKDFIRKCCVEDDMNRPNPKSQTLFRNLNVHNEIIRVLKLRYRDEYHYIFKLCYLFLKMFCQNNKTNQEILFPLLDFMLSQMGMQLNIADTLIALVKENYNICSQLDSFFIGHMIKLLYAKGHKPRYVHLLDAIVCAEDKTVKENQTIVATQVLAKREFILTNYHELKKKALDGSASNLAVVAKAKQEASAKEGKEEENKDDLLKKRAKLARINTTLASMTEGLDFKIDLETYELINATKVTKDEDELLYHVAIIDLLAKTCKDKNHATEALCQALYTVPEIIKIIRDGEAGPLVKAAYTRFLSEVWLFTERPLNLHMDEQVWDLIRFYREDIRKFKKISPMENNYIFEGVLFIIRTFFSCEFPELSPERIAVCNDLLSALIEMLAKFKHDAHKVNAIINTILQVTSSNIKGINSTIGTEKVNDIIEKARKSLGTIGHKTLKNLRKELIEEKRKTAYLKMYIKKLSEEKATGSSKTILVEEFDKIVRVFKDKLMKKKKKKDEKEVAGSNNFMKRKGAQYVQKLIVQLQSEEDDKKLIIDCLSILTAMIELEDAPIQKLSVKKLGKTLAELKEPDKKKLELIWREKVQNRLGELGAMKEAIPLFKSTSPALIYSALTLCCAMLAGGNRKIQEKMMEFFLSTPDPHFFDDIRSRIAGAVTELKNKRRQANTVKRRNISSQGSVMLDENELDEIFEVSSSKKENEKDNIQKLLLFMQNLCEGHYTEMKDYLRDQWDNTKSFNLVKECVSLATELERGVEEHFELANQLFRTLNEFASGCAGNQATIAEAKVHVSFNRIMARFPQCNDDDILELKNSMLDLMLSLVEGMFPEKETSTSFVPDVLVENVDFLALEATMENGIKFSEVRSDFEVLQLNIQRRQKLMQQQLMKTVVALGDSGAADERRDSLPEIPAKERAETPEESQKAKNVVSKCLILMQILAKYDDDKKTQAKAILKKTEWANYSQENIGNIELLNESGELEQVYFTIPPVCHNLQEATKEEFLKVVKRESPTDKIDDFVRRSGTLQYEIYHHSKLAKSRVHFLSALYTPIRNLLLLITVIVNGLMIGLYDGETLQYSEYTRYIFYGLCGLHLLISTAWVGVYMWMWAPVIIFRRVQDRKEELREANVLLRKEGKKLHSTEIGWFRKMSFLLTDGLLVYHFLFWFFSVVSIPYFPVMAFHMIDLSVRSDGVVNVVKAVTTNGRSLILTAVLLINLIYIYTVIGYFGLPSSYASNNCENLYVCILYNINAGIRNGGGIGDVLGDVAPGDSTYIGRFFFDLTFFLIIIILGLNIVFGIILDTFGQLRDQKSFIEEDMRSKCFICGIDSDTFQRQALGFKHHIKHDHNMWSYLYFFIYLDEKDQDEYTFIEEYVAEKRKAGENDYFPISKAICLKSKKKKKGG